jgi:hypothetical protein
VLMVVLFSVQVSFAQYSTVGPLSGSTFSDDNSIGHFPFSIPSNAVASDNSRSSANALLILLNGNTHYLKVTGFGFSIPALATVTGIRVEVEKSAWDISILATVRDNEIRLVKGGSVVGDNKANSSSWTVSDNYNVYGDTTDDWDESWTPAEINASDFGVVFSARIAGLISLIPTARVDHIRVTVFYIVSLPIHFIDFTATSKRDDKVSLKWITGDNDEKVNFTVQRSTDCSDWTDLATIPGSIAVISNSYEYFDHIFPDDDRLYYRIKMTKLSGHVLYSKIVYTDIDVKYRINLYPNPAVSEVFITYPEPADVYLFSITGEKIKVDIEQVSDKKLKINTACLRKGMYVIRDGDKQRQLLIQ